MMLINCIQTRIGLLAMSCLFWLTINGQAYSKKLGKRNEKMNIVMILVDDLGVSDVGYAREKPGILTPNIDRLAMEGMTFINAYAAAPVCSPTRASILTGKYPATLKLTCHIPGVGIDTYTENINRNKRLRDAFFTDHLPKGEMTIAELLKGVGYRTALIGKWHLAGAGAIHTTDGMINPTYQPEQFGFGINIGGCAYGQPASYFSPYRNATIADGPEGEYLTDRLADEAVRFIRDHSDDPFFLLLATYSVHTPLSAPELTVQRHGGNKYHAMIEELDKNVGKIIETLEKLHLTEQTMVIFYSDNGGVWENPPFRGTKGSLFEGGIRVPFIIKMPTAIRPGNVNETLLSSVDVLPTILDIVDIEYPKSVSIDGVSLWPAMRRGTKQRRDPIYWYFPHHRDTPGSMGAAIRDGDWKLIHFFEDDSTCLFNLRVDPGEQENLAAIQPATAKRLFRLLEKWQKTVGAEMPTLNF